MVLERLVVEIGADIAKLETALSSADSDFTAFFDRVGRAGRSLTLAVTLPILAAGGAAVLAAADFDALHRGLEAVTGSGAEAEAQFARLREIAKLPAVDLEMAAQTSIAFQAIGEDAQFAERMIRGVANAVALSGGGSEAFGGVMRQLRQVASLGRLMGEEMNVILENAPAMATALQSAFGTTSTERIRALNLTTEEFFERLMTGMEALPQVSGGVKNSLDNLWQSLRQGAAAIGEVLLPVIVPLVDGLGSFLDELRETNPVVLQWGVALAGVAAMIGPLLLLIAQLVPALVALKASSVALLPLLGAGGLIAVGLVALGVIILDHARALRQLEEATADLEEAERRLNDGRERTPGGQLRRIGELQAQYDALGGAARLAEVQTSINARGPQRSLYTQSLINERDALLAVATSLRTLQATYIVTGRAADELADTVDDDGNGTPTIVEKLAVDGEEAAEQLRDAKAALEELADELAKRRPTPGLVLPGEVGAGVPDKEAAAIKNEPSEPIRDSAADKAKSEIVAADIAEIEAATKQAEELGRAIEGWAVSVADQLVDLVTGVEDLESAFRGLFATIIREVARLAALSLVRAILDPVGTVAGGVATAVGASASSVATVTGAASSVATTVAPAASIVVPAPTVSYVEPEAAPAFSIPAPRYKRERIEVPEPVLALRRIARRQALDVPTPELAVPKIDVPAPLFSMPKIRRPEVDVPEPNVSLRRTARRQTLDVPAPDFRLPGWTSADYPALAFAAPEPAVAAMTRAEGYDSASVVPASTPRTIDVTGIADDAVILATGRRFKEILSNAYRSLEADGFRPSYAGSI